MNYYMLSNFVSLQTKGATIATVDKILSHGFKNDYCICVLDTFRFAYVINTFVNFYDRRCRDNCCNIILSVISYITSTPFRFMSLEETTFVSAVELTDISVIALVLSLALISMVNFLIIPLSIRFFTRLLTADSDNPISLAISTNDLRESFCKVCIIFSSTESRSDDISPLLLFRKQVIHYFQCSSNSFFIYYKWRK